MVDLVRASSLIHVPELISAHGGDPARVLAEAGIEPQVVGDYNRFISYTALTAVVGRASETLAVSDFGLRLSRLQDLEMLGPIAVLVRNSETVESALLGVTKFLHTYSPAIAAELHTHGRESSFTFAHTLRRLPYREQMVELALGVILGMFQLLVGHDFHPHRITFRHPRISAEDVYVDYFRCAVHFGAPVNSLVFPTVLLNRRVGGGDDMAYALATRYLGGQHRHLGVDEHVHELLGKLIPLGHADLDSVAAALTIHPRVLQRRLAEQGTTFEELLDDHRRTLATELLATSNLSMSDIARQLGYSEQSTLTRSCRRWFGRAPLALRRELRHTRSDRPVAPPL
ncbi:AraC family transcriptional regulator [Nocardia higoensis]|uniref:AraC family transcriptional regulator n=1 Tax=Nocardia higoensis TaxID=228599 RepID=UPI000687213F|nr:AraC family transcriptional regulator [Nocardia higoensis]